MSAKGLSEREQASAWQGPKPPRDNAVGVIAMQVAMIRESDNAITSELR